ncbi:MAG TPA: TIGR02466 family protein [Polyangia bacterium]|nr:TIGR02466 family protein [Polyangia bacterium]
MPIKPWFPTFIYDSPLQPRGNDAFARALLDDCHKIRAHDRAGERWCRKNYPGGYTSYGTMTNLHQTFSTFIELEAKIRRHVNRFARRLDMNLQGARLAMTDCWVNVMSRHAVHSLHLHPLAVVSGTYYVATPPGSSRLRFEDPRLDKLMGAPPKRDPCRPENRQQVSYDVAAGKLILFESWLRHEVASNPTRGERVSISFNYNWI